MNIHYALQTCDSSFNQTEKRFCADAKQEVIKKCVTSFFNSIVYVSRIKTDVAHIIKIFDDHSSQETLDFLNGLKNKYSSKNIIIEVESLNDRGVMSSIKSCYDWLLKNGTDLVYQVQDDYLFFDSAIYEMVDAYFQLLKDCDTMSIVMPYNPPYIWNNLGSYYYKNKVSSPRVIMPGVKRYWIQAYDTSCSFMTSIHQMRTNRDLLETFVSMDPKHSKLEIVSLNRMFTERGILGIMPVNSVALHMQSEMERDPYIEWEPLWESIDEDTTTR
jgi:hypothetical protein